MAWHRVDPRKDGTSCTRVFFRHNGRQSCLTFDDHAVALRFEDLIGKVGADRALEIAHIERRTRGQKSLTVSDWVRHHVAHLSGVEKRTRAEYEGVVKNNLDGDLGELPLVGLTRDDISNWLEGLLEDGASGKTIANKHGLLSAALNSAVSAGHITSNPAAGARLPRTEKDEMRFLSHDEFATLHGKVTEAWQPMVRFLVASGARISEVTALRPTDVQRDESTVRISRAWKRGPGGYTIGAPKTKRSVRTINVPTAVLDELDYTGEWLFTNPGRGRRAQGGPVRPVNFRANVWKPAVERAALTDPQPRIHDLRHTCASWMIAAGVPLPVIQRHLGHESITTTVDTYGHLDRASAQAAADAIGVALGG
ncbi:MAG: site-specific integrase [Mycobacterium sp.]